MRNETKPEYFGFSASGGGRQDYWHFSASPSQYFDVFFTMLPDKESKFLLQFLNEYWRENGEYLVGFCLSPGFNPIFTREENILAVALLE